MSKPYTQTTNNNKITRIFENTLQEELVWHRDRTNRIVKIVEGQGWKFQMDNDIPKNYVQAISYIYLRIPIIG